MIEISTVSFIHLLDLIIGAASCEKYGPSGKNRIYNSGTVL
jgi:hypothetical protein